MKGKDRDPAEAFSNAIGKTSSPVRTPNTTSDFYFWVRDPVRINPFDFVVAEHVDNSRTVGIVNEMYAVTDADSHLTNFIGSEFGDPQAAPYVQRVSTLVAKAHVLRNIPSNPGGTELYLPLAADRRVAFADANDVARALGFDQIRGTRIPAGVIEQSNGVLIPVFLDSHYMLGPEGAHVNASGISGLATKTSYLMFLMASIYQHLGDETAFVIFNVKHSDLLHIHEPARDLDEDDKKYLGLLGLRAEPFRNVEYFLPRGQSGRPDSDNPPKDHQLYAYALSDVAERLDMLFADVPDPQYTLDAFVQYVRREWDGYKVSFEPGTVKPPKGGTLTSKAAVTWKDLQEIPDALLGAAVYNNATHPTPPRLKRELSRLTSYTIFVQRRSSSEVYLGAEIKKRIIAGNVTVIDIYRVPTRNQGFVIGDVMRSIEEVYREKEAAKVPNLVVLIDELNTFAPAKAGEPNPITEQIIEIARKGRSRRTALFGAQQFKSEVHPQVWGNATIHVIGRTGSAELRDAAYAELDPATKESVYGLRPGELVVSSKTWRTAIKVRFPKPPYLRPNVD